MFAQENRRHWAQFLQPVFRRWCLQVILTHSKSRVVLEILKEAAQAKKRFRVYVTESMPDRAG